MSIELPPRLREIEKGGSSVSVPAGRVEVEVGDVTPVAVLRAEVPLSPGGELRHWPRGRPEGTWRTLDLQRSKDTFDSFNWFMEMLAIPQAIQGLYSIHSKVS